MSVALAGRAPATFEIKSATLPLVALLLKSPDLSALSQDLHARFGDKADFFDHDALVIDLTAVAGAAIDFAGLVNLLRGHRVHPVAVRGGTRRPGGRRPCRRPGARRRTAAAIAQGRAGQAGARRRCRAPRPTPPPHPAR
jgi:septum site-determining protein MinC